MGGTMPGCPAPDRGYVLPACTAKALDAAVFETQKGVATGPAGCVAGNSSFKNMFGYKRYTGESYDGSCSFFEGTPPLPEAIGWVICLVLGCAFAALVGGLVYLSNKNVSAENQTGTNSEVFSTAGRTISAGLTAADVVSKWTWAATLLQSSNVAWNYGVSGPFWYASGATIQVLLFAILAIEVKRKCPAIHTMLEIVLCRWGSTAHLTFLFFGLMTCLIVTAMLILGGAATINALTGMNVYAANFAIPMPVMLYTAFGGLKGTYYASFTHTAVIYLALLIFLWKIYAGPSDIGSVDTMHENPICASHRQVAGGGSWNQNGQYITMRSSGGLMFGIINTVGNFGTVFVDQSYWQGAIACKPSATYRGYLLGGMAWFAIPFSMATALGLAGRALDLPITAGESGSGLVPPAVATHLMGQGGAFLVAFQLFLAITSTANSEQLAVASLFSYDVYKRYMNEQATGAQMIYVSRVMVGAWSGLIAAIVAWVSVASQQKITVGDDCKSVVNVQTLGIIEPLLAGNLCALCVSAFVAIVCGLAAPQNYDWAELRTKTDAYLIEDDKHTHLAAEGEESAEAMDKAYYWCTRGAIAISLVLIFIWPALSLPVGDDGVFDLGYFKFWVALAFIWGHFAFLVTVILPIYEYFFGGWEADWEVEATAAKMQQQAPQQPMGFMMNPQGMPMQMPMQMPQSMPMQMPMQSM